jgi:hypothetical protein
VTRTGAQKCCAPLPHSGRIVSFPLVRNALLWNFCWRQCFLQHSDALLIVFFQTIDEPLVSDRAFQVSRGEPLSLLRPKNISFRNRETVENFLVNSVQLKIEIS